MRAMQKSSNNSTATQNERHSIRFVMSALQDFYVYW
jgi:hypothetical protein